jgi:6,7-dimethyl-8-ribityllumazine synthase
MGRGGVPGLSDSRRTPHFDYIARAAADGIMRAAQETGVPVTFVC